MIGEIAIASHVLCPKGQIVLWRNGQVVWCGPLGSPIADAEFDAITLNPEDHAGLCRAVDAHNQHPVTRMIHDALTRARRA